jgi:hypothetical protein
VDTPKLHLFSLCAGTGMLEEGFCLALETLGIRGRVVGYCERESGSAAMLLARMEESSLWKTSEAKAFEAWWTESLAESPANRSPWRESRKDWTTKGGSGMASGGSPGTAARDSSRLKMSAGLFDLDYCPSSMTLPKAGGLRNGCIFERPMWVPRTSGNAYSSWLSPQASDSDHSGPIWATPRAGKITSEDKAAWQERSAKGEVSTPPLTMQAQTWTTPTLDDVNNVTRSSGCQKSLALDARTWATPTGSGTEGLDRGENLQTIVNHWPTPAARDSKGANGKEHMTSRERPHVDQLANAAVHVFSPPDPTTPDGPTSLEPTPTSRRRLNPAFVCWLMGWPWFWTRTEPTSYGRQVTEWWCSKLRWLLRNFYGGSNEAR